MIEKAIADYNVALSNVSTNDKSIYLTYYNRGLAYFNNKQYQPAINDFNQAITSAQKFQRPLPEAYKYRAQSHMELKNYSEAIRDFETYLKSKPDDIQAVLFQGYAYLKNGDTEKAKSIAQRVIQMDPTNELYFSGNRILEIYNLDLRRQKSRQLTEDAQTYITEQKSIPSRTLANIKISDAFNNLDTAWLYSPTLTKEDRILKDSIREKLFVVYPLMRTKPEISELVRKYVVQAQSATTGKNYDEAIQLWSKA